jgi:transmembrane sensor
MSENENKHLDFVVKHYQEGKLDTRKAISKFNAEHGIAPAPMKRKGRGWIYFASGIAAAVLLGVMIRFALLATAEVTLVAEGSKEVFLLPDSTRVTLARGGTLSYKEWSFKRGSRRVNLTGKGYFEVTKDAGHPFEVTTENSFVKVLGTKFLLETLPVAKVSLYEGKVHFARTENLEGVILTEGMSALIPIGAIKPKVEHKGNPNGIAWIRGTFVFEDTPLKEVLLTLGNYYGVSFGATDMKKRLSGEFSTEDLDLIIELIESALDVKIVKM